MADEYLKSWTETFSAGTGDEHAIDLEYTVNKATSGDDYFVRANKTNTASPGTSYAWWYGVGGSMTSQLTSAGAMRLASTLDLGGQTDATLAYSGVGQLSIAGSVIYSAGGTDVPLTDGGTGASTAADARTNLGLGTIATQNSATVAITGGSITGITDLTIADGGTGASDAGTARSNLGLSSMATQGASAVAITGGSIAGTALTLKAGTVPVSEGLLEWHTANDTMLVGSGSTTLTFSDDSKILLKANNLAGVASPSTALSNLGGQATNARLDDISGLGVTANTFVGGNGTNLVLVNAADTRTALGLGALATLNTVAAGQIDSNAVTSVKINAEAVTVAKLQQIAQYGLFSRTNSGTGVVTEIAGTAWLDALVVPHGLTGSYTANVVRTGANTYSTIKHNLVATTAPGSSNDSTEDYAVGSLWVDVNANKSYICVDSGAAAAIWNDLTASGGGGATDLDGLSDVTITTATRGDLLIRGASGWTNVGLGTSGYVLTSDGTDAAWAAATGGTPTAITVADESLDTTCFPLFVTAATGDLGPKTATGLTFDSTTDILTAAGFSGPLTGNVTGNVTGTAATVTGAIQSAITQLGTLTTLTVDSITINGNSITSSGAIGISPNAGSAITFDGTITLDAGVIAGATSITSTAFIGDLTGNADTVSTNANLTGVVTSIGNATSIADKALAISKLADGTDGELITWGETGVIETIAVGTSGHVLTSNGVGAAPTFQAAAGGGTVDTSGTPANTYLARFTDADTITGDANIIYSGTSLTLGSNIDLTLAGVGQVIVGTGLTASAPDYTFNGDTDTGMYRSASDAICIAAGGLQAMRWQAANSHIRGFYQMETGVTASGTQTQGNGAIFSAYVEVATVTAPNDVITLPNAATGQRQVIVNNGANTLQIFPDTSDQIDGGGANNSITLPAGEAIELLGVGGTDWFTIGEKAGAGGGDLWSDAVDSDIIPDGAGTRDLGSTTAEFQEGWINQLYIANGAVGTPSLAFNADQDTGIYGDASNSLYFAVGGDVGLHINGTASAVNYPRLVPGTAGQPVIFDTEGTDLNVDWRFDTKGSGVFRFNCDVQPHIAGYDFGLTGTRWGTGYLADLVLTNDLTFDTAGGQILADGGTVALPGISLNGDNDTGIYSPGANQVGITAGGDEVALFNTAGATAVNYLDVTNSVSGSPVLIAAAGEDTDVGITLTPKGAGTIVLNGTTVPNANGTRNLGSSGLRFANAYADALWVTNSVRFTTNGHILDSNGNEAIGIVATASAVNHISFVNQANAFPQMIAAGDDANVNLRITSKGSGGIYLDGVTTPWATGTNFGQSSQRFGTFYGQAINLSTGGSSIAGDVTISGTGALMIPVGTDAQRTATQGAIRYNTTGSNFEGYDGTGWQDLQSTGGASALADLTDVSAATQTNGFVLASSGGAYAGRALVSGDIPDLSGTYQVVDAEITALAGLTSAADTLPFFTGVGTASVTTLTSFGRTLISEVNAANARATLGAASALADLSDVSGATQTNGFVLASSGGAYAGRALVAGDLPDVANISGSTYTTIQHMQDTFHSSGVITGGGITDDTDGTITVAAGTGTIRATDSDVAQILFFDWASENGANVALTDNAMNYIYVQYNAGSPQVVRLGALESDYNTNVFLGTVYRSGTTLYINDYTSQDVGDHARRMLARMNEVMPFDHASGGVSSDGGSLAIDVSAGVWWAGLNRFTTTAVDTSIDQYTRWYNPAGGWTAVTGQTVIDNEQYDNAGTLTNLGVNDYGVHWIYLDVNGNVHTIYGTQSHNTVTAAEGEAPPTTIPDELQEGHGRLIGRAIVGDGDAQLTSVDSVLNNTLTFAGGISDHNSLNGLQGGTTDDYQHLTSAQLTVVQNTSNTNSGDVSLAGTPDYITISGQVITRNQIDLTNDVAGVLPEANLPNAAEGAEGVVELATTTEIDAGTDTARVMAVDQFAASDYGISYVSFAVYGAATDTATGTALALFVVPAGLDGWDIVEAHAEVVTAGTTGTLTVDVNINGTTIFLTNDNPDIGSGQLGSDTGTGSDPGTIDTGANGVSQYDRITVDVDAVYTAAAKGLTVTIGFRKP